MLKYLLGICNITTNYSSGAKIGVYNQCMLSILQASSRDYIEPEASQMSSQQSTAYL
jgi:hypothetical protein